jgi:hypothetical protein
MIESSIQDQLDEMKALCRDINESQRQLLQLLRGSLEEEEVNLLRKKISGKVDA